MSDSHLKPASPSNIRSSIVSHDNDLEDGATPAQSPRSARSANAQDLSLSSFNPNASLNYSRTRYDNPSRRASCGDTDSGVPSLDTISTGESIDLTEIETPVSRNPNSRASKTGGGSELYSGWFQSYVKSSPASRDAGGLSVNSYLDFAKSYNANLGKYRFDNGDFVAPDERRYYYDPTYRILRDTVKAEPVDPETGNATSMQKAVRIPLLLIGGKLEVASDGAEANASGNSHDNNMRNYFSSEELTEDVAATLASPPRSASLVADLAPKEGYITQEPAPPGAPQETMLSSSRFADNEDASVQDLNLRESPERSKRPFKELDEIDRNFIRMHENTTFAMFLWLTVIGTILNFVTHLVHGWSYNPKFAQTKTPDGPVNGVYFQDKQSDKSQSLRHAMRAAIGAPNGITKQQFDNWRRRMSQTTGVEEHEAIVSTMDIMTEPLNLRWRCYGWTRQRHVSSQINKDVFVSSGLERANEFLESSGSNALIMSLGTNNASGGMDKEWVAFRKDPAGGGRWTLINASQYIIDSKNGYQPEISPVDYLAHKFDRHELDGFEIIYSEPLRQEKAPTDQT